MFVYNAFIAVDRSFILIVPIDLRVVKLSLKQKLYSAERKYFSFDAINMSDHKEVELVK